MKFAAAVTLVLAVVLLPLQPPGSRAAAAGAVENDSPPPPGGLDGARSRNRERWERLPPEKQRRLERIFERLATLPAAERSRLIERLRGMDPDRLREALTEARRARDRARGKTVRGPDVERESLRAKLRQDADQERRILLGRKLEQLPAEERQKLRAMAPEERKAHLKSLVKGERKKVLSALPPALREKAENLPPREQIEFLRKTRGERAFRDTFRDPEEAARLRALPRAALGKLRFRREGPPPPRPEFISEETWKRWLELKPYERPRVLRHLLDS
ncbi:MAG TPA: hypothetical protein VMT52_14800 [Planctomycetota bacterium]|nr:hypothetical protein [Planctomycetota bacterium]